MLKKIYIFSLIHLGVGKYIYFKFPGFHISEMYGLGCIKDFMLMKEAVFSELCITYQLQLIWYITSTTNTLSSTTTNKIVLSDPFENVGF